MLAKAIVIFMMSIMIGAICGAAYYFFGWHGVFAGFAYLALLELYDISDKLDAIKVRTGQLAGFAPESH